MSIKYQIAYHSNAANMDNSENIEMFEDSLFELRDYSKALKNDGFSNIDIHVSDDEAPALNSQQYRICIPSSESVKHDQLWSGSNDFGDNKFQDIFVDQSELDKTVAELKSMGISNIMVFQKDDEMLRGKDDPYVYGHPMAIYNFDNDSFSISPSYRYELITLNPETSKFERFLFVGTPDELKKHVKEFEDNNYAVSVESHGASPEFALVSQLSEDGAKLFPKSFTIGDYFKYKQAVRDQLSDVSSDTFSSSLNSLCDEITRTENLEVKSGMLDEENLEQMLQDKDRVLAMLDDPNVSHSDLRKVILRMTLTQQAQQQHIREEMERMQADLRACKAVVEEMSKSSSNSLEGRMNESKAYQFISNIGKSHRDLCDSLAKVRAAVSSKTEDGIAFAKSIIEKPVKLFTGMFSKLREMTSDIKNGLYFASEITVNRSNSFSASLRSSALAQASSVLDNAVSSLDKFRETIHANLSASVSRQEELLAQRSDISQKYPYADKRVAQLRSQIEYLINSGKSPSKIQKAVRDYCDRSGLGKNFLKTGKQMLKDMLDRKLVEAPAM